MLLFCVGSKCAEGVCPGSSHRGDASNEELGGLVVAPDNAAAAVMAAQKPVSAALLAIARGRNCNYKLASLSRHLLANVIFGFF